MDAPDLSARISQLETQLAELAVERGHDRQALERLRQALDFDAVTGAHSRLYFDSQLAQALQRLRRDAHDGRSSSVVLALVDVDHLKRINDSVGHLAGDRALREVATICGQVLRRQTDIVARYGGDEFALLLPQTTLPTATQLAEKIRADVSTVQVKGVALGVSIGLAASPTHGLTARALLDAADRALYRAKQTRNAVARAD